MAGADLIVLERNSFGDTLGQMNYWKMRGKSILMVFDDAYHLMHSENPAYEFWHDGIVEVLTKQTVKDPETGEEKEVENKVKLNVTPKPLDMLTWGIQMSKGVQTPNKILA